MVWYNARITPWLYIVTYRIKPLCNLLFEVGHLSYASPSTISRIGIIYVDPKDLGYKPFWERWMEPRSLMEQTALDHCFQKYIPTLLNLILGNDDGVEKSFPLRISVSQTKLNMASIKTQWRRFNECWVGICIVI